MCWPHTSCWRRRRQTSSRRAERLLADACDRLLLSMRARRRMQSVAATVAALDGRPAVGEDDVAEALAYRVEPR